MSLAIVLAVLALIGVGLVYRFSLECGMHDRWKFRVEVLGTPVSVPCATFLRRSISSSMLVIPHSSHGRMSWRMSSANENALTKSQERWFRLQSSIWRLIVYCVRKIAEKKLS